ncbi:MAG: LamG domain-containing protein, partial [Deltaproteobacteria bacterium]|nr:LamG domain-containing protein [Deltaproteobacteria bacterium]
MFTPHIITKLKAALVGALIVVCFPTASTFAWNGNYLIVDGNGDYAQFLAEGPLEVGENNSKSFTVEFWVMPTKYGAIISDDAYDIGYVRDASTGRDVIQFRLWFDGENSVVIKRQADLLGSGWHHVVCAFDNTRNMAAIGVDGDIDWLSNVIDDDGLFNWTSPFLIGSFRPSSGFFTGGIDEVRISDRVRYSGYSYLLPSAPFGDDADTLALWHFDDAPGATIFADSSINGNDLVAVGDAVTGFGSSGVNSEMLFLRYGGFLMEEIGSGVPWLEWYLWPTNPSSRQWETILTGDIAGSFSYQIDITQCTAEATIKIEFIVDGGSGEITVAADNVSFGPLDPGYYHDLTRNFEGLDIATSDGDKFILRISHLTGTEPVAVAFDGRSGWNDSRVTFFYPGLDACFTVSPE